jgi:hypothetical protein
MIMFDEVEFLHLKLSDFKFQDKQPKHRWTKLYFEDLQPKSSVIINWNGRSSCSGIRIKEMLALRGRD